MGCVVVVVLPPAPWTATQLEVDGVAVSLTPL